MRTVKNSHPFFWLVFFLFYTPQPSEKNQAHRYMLWPLAFTLVMRNSHGSNCIPVRPDIPGLCAYRPPGHRSCSGSNSVFFR